jgi:hypothetical protein
MLRVYCDFNDCTTDERYWILWYGGRPLQDQVDQLGLKDHTRVLLYQDDDDFEVEGIFLLNQTDIYTNKGIVCVRPEWTTRRG